MTSKVYTFAAAALALLAADVCHGAAIGPGEKKVSGTVIDKKTAMAIGLTRPHHGKDGWHEAKHDKHHDGSDKDEKFHKDGSDHWKVNANGVKDPGPAWQGPKGFPGADTGKTLPPGKPVLAAPQGLSPILTAKSVAGTPFVKTAVLPPTNVVGGTVMKRHTSTMVALGGATTGKGTGQINGTALRLKPH